MENLAVKENPKNQIKKPKKSNKRFRKTRSKKQRGGTVADSYLIRASGVWAHRHGEKVYRRWS